MPEPENPYEPILSLQKPRSKGTLNALQIKMWRVFSANLIRLNVAMREQNDEGIHRASQVAIQAGHLLHKVMETGDLEERIQRLEQERG